MTGREPAGPSGARPGGRGGHDRPDPAGRRSARGRAGAALCTLFALITVPFQACSAPASRPATGDVARDLERSIAGGTAAFDHAVWDTLLAEGTRDGLVDYEYMSARSDALARYLVDIAAADLASLAPAELEALLINAYNALTVRAILDHPDVSSIREIDGVWTGLEWDVGGHSLTLDNLEHNLLRPFFRDPRVHFVLNCASMSCAPLPPWAFRGDSLDAQLEERTRAFLRDPRNVRLEGDVLRVSRYFDWYADDFTAEGWEPRAETIAAFIARYAGDEVRAAVERSPDVELAFLEYDWSLNAVGRPARAAPEREGVAGLLERFRRWVAAFGAAAPLVYGLGYVLAVVLLIPGAGLTIGAGLTFGLAMGTAVVVLAANAGACLAFLIARYLLRARVERWLAGREKLGALDRAVESQGWRVVALTRLSPAFPFNVQNYFYGLTGVSFAGYALASLVGMLPGTLLYVSIGAAGAEVAAAAGGAASRGRTALLVAGLVATLVVVVLITRVARRELDRATGDPAGGEGSTVARGAGASA